MGDDYDVCAIADGVVKRIGYDEDLGVFVEVTHKNGYTTLYAAFNEQVVVKEKESVSKGDIVAKISLAGSQKERNIHFEVRHDDVRIVLLNNDAKMLNPLHKSINISMEANYTETQPSIKNPNLGKTFQNLKVPLKEISQLNELYSNGRIKEFRKKIETPQLDIYFNESDNDIIKNLVSLSIYHLQEVSLFFGHNSSQKFGIYLFDTREDRNLISSAEVHYPNIYVWSEKHFCPGPNTFHEFICHELTHMIEIDYLGGSWCEKSWCWLNEGLADYLSKQSKNGAWVDNLKYFIYFDQELQPFRKLIYCTDWEWYYTHQYWIVYSQSHSIIEYLMNNYGRNKVIMMFDKSKLGYSPNETIEKSIGVGMDELEINWRMWLKDKYKIEFPNANSYTRPISFVPEYPFHDVKLKNKVLLDVPIIDQKNSPSCASCAMWMVLNYWGCNVAFDIVLSLIGLPNEDGIFPSGNNLFSDLNAWCKKHFNLTIIYHTNSTLEELKTFLAKGFPVVVLQHLSVTDKTGHDRVVVGYDEEKKVIIVNDSMTNMYGKNYRFPEELFTKLWEYPGGYGGNPNLMYVIVPYNDFNQLDNLD